MFSLVLDPTALDPKPDGPPDPVLVRDVILSVHRVRLLLVQLDADVPGLVASHLLRIEDFKFLKSRYFHSVTRFGEIFRVNFICK